MIGGATTSRVHTAVKIDPSYRAGPVVHVNDASRAVGVASSLLSPERREAYAAEVRAEYAKISDAHMRAQADKKRLKLATARANRVPVDFAANKPVKPTFLGTRSFDDYDLAELVPYIDWTPFFQTWELAGRFPAILDDAKVGEVARSLYDDARKMLDLIVKEKWFRARATVGFWPANAQGDDIVLYADESRTRKIATLHTLRQQLEKREGRFNAALADFVAPAAPACPIMSAASSSPPASARMRSPTASRWPMTTTPRSCARRWPTAWPRPSPSACMPACAASSGPMRRTRRSRPTI